MKKTGLGVLLFSLTLAAAADTSTQRELQVPELPGGCGLFFVLGFDVDAVDDESLDRFYKDDSSMSLAQGGTFVGKGAIQEYVVSATAASPFLDLDEGFVTVPRFSAFFDPEVVGMDHPSVGLCQFLFFIGTRTKLSVELTGRDETIERPSLVKVLFDPAANKVDQVLVYYEPKWLSYFFESLDTAETTSFMCDAFVADTCADTAALNEIATKEECEERMNELPLFDGGNAAYFDGDSRSCRIVHSVFAMQFAFHCPHISFVSQADDDGKTLCQESAGLSPDGFFDPLEVGAFEAFKKTMGLTAKKAFRVVGRDDVLCPLGKVLKKNGKCSSFCKRKQGVKFDKATNVCASICDEGEVFRAKRGKCVKLCKAKKGEVYDPATMGCIDA